jgi:hypothetical protein
MKSTALNSEKNYSYSDDEEERYFAKYRLMAERTAFNENQYWLIYSIFIAGMGILLSNFAQSYNDLCLEFKIGISFIGFLMCHVWLFVCSRSITFRNERISRAKEILKKTAKGKFRNDEQLELWNEEKKIKSFRGHGISGRFSSSKVSLLFIYLSTVIWGDLFINELLKLLRFNINFLVVLIIVSIIGFIVSFIDFYLKFNCRP